MSSSIAPIKRCAERRNPTFGENMKLMSCVSYIIGLSHLMSIGIGVNLAHQNLPRYL